MTADPDLIKLMQPVIEHECARRSCSTCGFYIPRDACREGLCQELAASGIDGLRELCLILGDAA